MSLKTLTSQSASRCLSCPSNAATLRPWKALSKDVTCGTKQHRTVKFCTAFLSGAAHTHFHLAIVSMLMQPYMFSFSYITNCLCDEVFFDMHRTITQAT